MSIHVYNLMSYILVFFQSRWYHGAPTPFNLAPHLLILNTALQHWLNIIDQMSCTTYALLRHT